MSPSRSFASSSFRSTADATPALRQLSTKLGANAVSVVMLTLVAPTALMRSLAFALVNPSCVRMKAGVLSRIRARCSDQAMSSAVSGLPDAKRRPGRSSNVNVRPSALTVHALARSPASLEGSAGSCRTSRS
jgi:hypothetical protein